MEFHGEDKYVLTLVHGGVQFLDRVIRDLHGRQGIGSACRNYTFRNLGSRETYGLHKVFVRRYSPFVGRAETPFFQPVYSLKKRSGSAVVGAVPLSGSGRGCSPCRD